MKKWEGMKAKCYNKIMERFWAVSAFLTLIIFSLPQFSYAAGLVPCDGLDCTICDLGILANNIINWLVNFSFAAGAAMVIYGGYLIMTAGLSPKQYAEGKDIIFAAAIGLGIILVSWIIINTTLYYVTGSETWYTITCDLTK